MEKAADVITSAAFLILFFKKINYRMINTTY